MDALTVALPAATIAGSGSSYGDSNALDTRQEASGAGEFAALLAAGLMPPVPLPAVQEAVGIAPGAEDTVEGLVDEPSLAAEATLGEGAPAPRTEALPLTAALAFRPTGSHAAATDEPLQGGNATGTEAATIAAAAAGEAAGVRRAVAEESEFELAGLRVMAATPEPGAVPAQPLLSSAPERPAEIQPSALLDVGAPVDTPDFAQALSRQVVWMADKDAQVAELRINPPELGPVEVRLQLSGDEAAVQFVSAHPEVRSAIESAIARLRESMAEAGIQLGEASVSAESFRDQSQAQARNSGARGGRDAEGEWAAATPLVPVRRGLVDLFA